MQLAHLAQELGARHAGHALIHEEQRDRRAAPVQLVCRVDGLLRRRRRHDAVRLTIVLSQIALDGTQHFVVVVDHQDDGLCAHEGNASFADGSAGGFTAGNVTRNSVPVGLVRHVDRAVMALNDPPRDVETKAGALADFLGREKWIEDAMRRHRRECRGRRRSRARRRCRLQRRP